MILYTKTVIIFFTKKRGIKMIEFKDKSKYKKYVDDLNSAISEGKASEFVKENKFFEIYLKQQNNTYNINGFFSTPYYDEIPIENITCWNSPDCTIRNENWYRVTGSIKYILEDKCRPIAVIKLENDKYYIENGKHRFYAHILLGKKRIPVSVREPLENSIPEESMLNYSIPFYMDGVSIAYPEKAEKFISQYAEIQNEYESISSKIDLLYKSMQNISNNEISDKKQFFELEDQFSDLRRTIKNFKYHIDLIKLNPISVEMKKMDENRHELYINMSESHSIRINGVCSAGNENKASQCTYNILKNLGYSIDMEFIRNNVEFTLYGIKDRNAHNIKFYIDIDISSIENDILPNIKQKKAYNYTTDSEHDFYKLMDYISKYNHFETPNEYGDYMSSSIVTLENKNYYLFVVENKNLEKNMYIFRSNEIPFNNLTIKFLGKIEAGTDLYEKLTS